MLHNIFTVKKVDDTIPTVLESVEVANKKIDAYFSTEKDEEETDNSGRKITETIENHLKGFMGNEKGKYKTNSVCVQRWLFY